MNVKNNIITIVIYYNRNDTDHKKENSKTKRKN